MQDVQTAPATGFQFSVGAVLSRSVTVFMKKPFLFCGLTLFAVLVPVAGFSFLRSLSEHSPRTAGFFLIFLLAVGIQVTQGAIAYAVYQVLHNTPTSFGAAFSRGVKRFWSLIGSGVLIGIGFRLGLALLIVPGLMLLSMWAVAAPVCVVERLDAVESMVRSAELTAGNRWRVFALSLLTCFIPFIAVLLSVIIARLFSVGAAAPLIILLLYVVQQAFVSVMTGIMYHDLRTAKEGVSPESLAQVFE